MIEIKFRAWDVEKNVYIYPELWDNKMPCNWKQFFQLEQFTGLHDKNGKEIYKEDILKDKYGNIGTAHWYGSGFEFINTSGMMESGSEWEVIGNIHENPELLK